MPFSPLLANKRSSSHVRGTSGLASASDIQAAMSAFAPFRSALGIKHLAVIEEAKAGQGQKGSDR